jgi:hypothetical protein
LSNLKAGYDSVPCQTPGMMDCWIPAKIVTAL